MLGNVQLFSSLTVLLLLALSFAGSLRAEDAPANTKQPPTVASNDSAATGDDFSEHVLPILRARCFECLSSKKRAGKLNLETPLGVVRGGESGPIVSAGEPDDSILWQKVHDEEMPPDEPLAGAEREVLRRWIAAGAHGLPDSATAGHAGDGQDHWAFRPPVRPPVPEVRDNSRVRTDIDRFVQAKLEAHGLTLGPEADRLTLIRRLSFDLVGLPPTVAEIAAFLADPADDAYERLVEHYLASPHYGERWGKHWLDAAGYADSNGYFNADTDRPLAYRYRDYVIRAHNADKPFDQFLIEQFAGDELAGYQPDGDVLPEQVDLYAATHFLRNAQDGTDSSDGNPDELMIDRMTVIEGTVQIWGSALLGLTVHCAKCHDHKFEPVTQHDYYALQAVLLSAYDPAAWVKAADRTLSIGTQAERAAHAAAIATLDAEIAALDASLEAAAAPLRRALQVERLAELDEATRDAVLAAFGKPEGERSDEDRALLEPHAKALDVDGQLGERFPEFARLKSDLAERKKKLEAQRPAPLERVSVLVDVHREPPAHHLFVRGDFHQLGDEVPPGVPAFVCSPDRQFAPQPPAGSDTFSTGRRMALARWFTAPDHPLVTRVTVNRIWQQHFGRGIVATTENFGYTGAEPTHPELLDYLATWFVADGRSMKNLHRLIVTSAVYRQTSTAAGDAGAAAMAADPENQLLWRYPLRRLDADALRDSMLAASGELNDEMFGPYVPTKRLPDGNVVVDAKGAEAARRSLYLQQRRTQVLSLLEVFDAPGMVTNCTRRDSSTVVLQSLSLLNADFVVERSAAMAARLAREAGDSVGERISLGFLLAYGRGPTADERAAAEQFVAEQQEHYTAENADKSDKKKVDAEEFAWRDFCQMLLASNGFLYVE
ncbi:MAG: PSD1 and planctomycete cytochrome C domain-containing protein [Pirellulales bacterium]